MAKKILITGASGGFGKLTVLTLLQKGHQVAASMRDIHGKNKNVADELRKAGAKIIEIDVTDDTSVNNGVQKAITDLDGLDVLINNAGLGVLGMQEFFTPADFQKVFDINVFGVQRMNRAVVPYFREKKNGLIVYTSSLLGRIALPFYGAYQSSKWALEALAENYRVELSGFGIENCIVEPGGYPTAFSDNLLRPSDNSREVGYGDFAKVPEAALHNFENVLKNNPQQNPQKVADAFAELIEKPKGDKPFRTAVDFIGMADHIQKYNEHLEQIMTGLYTNFGTQGMLSVRN
ncbi:short-chain dehydrogenase/reductase SDR [Flavobacterium cauense R2A-7]|jgi:NAD(P)-dependent dehydrogenase (short-subunit alcohol dehydrogenase family)|uniref:NADP-dependent 3-hydroxy acid dehydrogenase YdfG n=1 Tax=Flavobacterium cauense R2A-7 TaxID=1341154 RepID=V6S9V8_9FLAO|nr:SDR family oxidoreductase [Flavobacterium cauense]ESU21165.1 short-chain dehydrogenase/reductase SDR [Flavobacterium cauense R2A-7]KGO79292.1 short-chain dehydrogenase [Flavobacterium cauense R2A-7]TWI07907.1 NADP-dependent 3-hydroxy acid dehydrogenase YdfG [Flavobacterium cauense R2A-7]